jgi:ATP diphosphatase
MSSDAAAPANAAGQGVARLVEVMRRLRDPERGCPWDRAQTYASIVPYTIEEAYEVADAIARGDFAELEAELGDLLLQVAYYTQMASEEGRFDLDRVAHGIADKMIRRHPHVFAEDGPIDTERLRAAWEAAKARERAGRAAAEGRAATSVLDGVAAALPALLRAEKLQRRAARVGFDWPAAEGVLAKLEEELGELRASLAAGGTPAAVGHEIGDLLFTLVNLARHLGVDAESALRETNRRFERRFRHLEDALREAGTTPEAADGARLEALWAEAKRAVG